MNQAVLTKEDDIILVYAGIARIKCSREQLQKSKMVTGNQK